VRYRLTSKPFDLNADAECALQCAAGYWSNFHARYTNSTDVWDQRCTSDNCKTWDHTSDPLNTALNSDTCTLCWKDTDLDPYETWDGRETYTKQEVRYRDTTESWNLVESECHLQCTTNYWSNWGSTWNSASGNVRDQRCSSNNCKMWAYGTADSALTADTCTVCWAETDITGGSWDARPSYSEREISGRFLFTPFILNHTTAKCELQCRTGYWSNQNSWDPPADVWNQRCTSNNCKTWKYNEVTANPEDCDTCWVEADIGPTWAARASYLDQELAGRNTATPFSPDGTECRLQCTSNYWTNWKSSYNPAADVWHQTCTYNNCKEWNTHNISVLRELETFQASVDP
jgi:hypothetical protein